MRFEGVPEKEAGLEYHREMMRFKGKTWSSRAGREHPRKEELGSEGTEQGFQGKQVGSGRKRNRGQEQGPRHRRGVLGKEEETQGTEGRAVFQG